jgi:hypothetical protein
LFYAAIIDTVIDNLGYISYSLDISSLSILNSSGFMTKEKNIPYPQPMLNNVDYDNLGVDFFSLTNLEYKVLQNCSDFLGKLEEALLSAKMVQIPEMVVVQLCCYLGATTTIYNQDKLRDLEPEINNLLRRHSELSLSKFNHYLLNSNASTQSLLLDRLKDDTPGSILVQTLRLGRIIMDMMKNLSNNRSNRLKKQEDLICPQNKFFAFLIPLVNEQHEKWQEDLDGVSINHAINQLTIQIGWLVGYFSYLERKPNTNSYLEYCLPCIPLYMDYTNKVLQAMLARGQILTSIQQLSTDDEESEDDAEINDTETASLLNEIHELSRKTHSKIPPAITKFQKEAAIVKAGLEKLVIELIAEHMEIKVIYMSLFYFWFTLDVPLRGIPCESLDKLSPFEELENIISLIRKTTFKLPDPEFSSDLKMLNSKMQSLKLNLPNPEDLDNVPEDQVEYQSIRVNTAIHTLTSDYLKQDYHPEVISNVLFSQWLRLSVLYGVSEKEWQKMDHYFVEILAAVRNYIPTIINK